MSTLDRRGLVKFAAVATAMGVAGQVTGRAQGPGVLLPFEDPDFTLRTWVRLIADLRGGTHYHVLGGTVFGFRPQSDDVSLAEFARRLYGYRSCTARRASVGDDGAVTIRSRSWSYYTEVESGALIRTLVNPYTGQTVPCPPRASPISEQVFTRDGARPGPTPFPVESSDAGKPLRFEHSIMGGQVWLRRASFARFKPSDTTWWKLEADLLTYTASVADVRSASTAHIPHTTSHNLVAEWQTWMNMHGSPGHILFVGNGTSTPRLEGLPAALRRDLDAEFPGTLAEAIRPR